MKFGAIFELVCQYNLKGNRSFVQTSVAGVCGLVSDACQLWSLEAEQQLVVGGFSQGGHLALHAVYGAGLAVRAAFALSSFLVTQSSGENIATSPGHC